MDRKQLGITAQLCWVISLVLLHAEQVYAEDSVPADLKFLEWLGETIDARDVGIDMDALLAEYDSQINERDDVDQDKESSQ